MPALQAIQLSKLTTKNNQVVIDMKISSLILTTIIYLVFLSPGAFAQTTLTVQTGKPTLDGVISPDEWTSASLVTARGVTLQAMADEGILYLAATWADDTENAELNRLTFNGSQWSKSGDEDRIAFLFDMGQTGSDGVNCQAFCHFPGMSTNGGVVDVWNWQAGRTNPMGYSEDTYWDASGQKVDEGVSAVLVNDLDGSSLPTFMATSDPGAIKEFLVENASAMDAFDPFGALASSSVEEAISFNSGSTFTADDFIPGYVHRVPSGDIADVQSAGKYSNGSWTVEFSKPFEGGDHDFTVVPGETVKFAHEVFDNQGSNHAIDATPIDGVSYTLDFSLIPTDIERISSQVPTSYELKQNFPNPFNPSTTISFNIPEPGFARLQIVNILGQVVETLVDEQVQPGQYEVVFDAHALPSGMYYYRLSTEQFIQTRQMTLLK